MRQVEEAGWISKAQQEALRGLLFDVRRRLGDSLKASGQSAKAAPNSLDLIFTKDNLREMARACPQSVAALKETLGYRFASLPPSPLFRV